MNRKGKFTVSLANKLARLQTATINLSKKKKNRSSNFSDEQTKQMPHAADTCIA